MPVFLLSVTVVKAEEAGVTADVQEGSTETVVTVPYRRVKTAEKEEGLEGEYYFIQRPAMGMQLTYENKNESRTSDGKKVEDSYNRFKESIQLKTRGWVYHPALLKYSLMIEPEWLQTRENRSSGEEARVESFAPDYAISATILEPKPYTIKVGASRLEKPVWAAFAGNTESIVESYGAKLLLKYKMLPTTFGYEHLTTDQTGFYTSLSTRENITLSSQHQSLRSYSNLLSTYSEDERTSEGITTSIKSFNNTLSNSYRFFTLKDNRATLNSSLAYRTQDTTYLNSEYIRLREHLNWLHRKNLQSNYTFIHSRQDSDDVRSDQTSLEGRLTHLLYENLTTDIGGKTQFYNYEGGKENAYIGFLDFAYTRPFPKGTLNLNAGWEYQYTDRSGSGDAIAQVTNEVHLLSTGVETYLDNYGVDRESIIVTNSSGTTVYIENIDYAIEEIDNYIRIERLPFGSIADPQAVAVSYRYSVDSNYDDGLMTQSYGVNFDIFQNLRFSYSYVKISQNVFSGQRSEPLVDDTIHRAQVRYDLGWSDTSLTYEDNDRQSERTYTQWKVQEVLRYRLQRRLYFTLKGFCGKTHYTTREDTREFYGGVTTVDWGLSRRSMLRVEGYYDNTRSDVEDTENNGLKATVEYRFRIWKALLSYEMTRQDNKINDYLRDEQLIRLELIRKIW